ncbi:MAG TPA: AAA family ATPase [Solirubrobacterales bacterium]
MESSDRQAPRGTPPAPGLLVLTGASHTGKTSVARAVLDAAGPPAAFLSVDDVLATTIARPPGDAWAEIPLAYELLLPQVEKLLEKGWFVTLESTFTYVPELGAPEFHSDALQQLIQTAERHDAPWLLVQLAAGDDVARARADRTGRLDPDVVDRTAELHRAASLPETTLRLDSAERTPAELAELILGELERRSAVG